MKIQNADVIVIAAGAAGLAAAIAAAQLDLKVVVFEKEAIIGGTANKGMGPLGIESRHTRARLLEPTKDEAFKAFMDYTHWRVDANLVRAFLNKSGDTIHWLEDLGVNFVEPATYFKGSYSTWHLIQPEKGTPGPGAGATMTKILTKKAKELGVTFYMETAVKSLVKKDNRVVGVRVAQQKDSFEVKAQAVIIATGGFGNAPEMIDQHTEFKVDETIFPFRIPGITGDGIRMAWEVGAQKTEMGMELIYGMPNPLQIPPALHEACRQPHLLVNALGKRFIDEEVMGNVTYTGNAISLQKDKTAFLIFDDILLKEMEKDFDTRNRVFPETKFEGAEKIIDAYLKSGHGNFYKADSVEELCAQTGIPLSAFKETLSQYNVYCKNGYDAQFNKNQKYLRPLKGKVWYAARHLPSAYGSAGGIKINEFAEVIGQDWKPIEGLYAAGTDACAIYGDSYPFIFPGTSMGFALNTGRIAAESIAKRLEQASE